MRASHQDMTLFQSSNIYCDNVYTSSSYLHLISPEYWHYHLHHQYHHFHQQYHHHLTECNAVSPRAQNTVKTRHLQSLTGHNSTKLHIQADTGAGRFYWKFVIFLMLIMASWAGYLQAWRLNKTSSCSEFCLIRDTNCQLVNCSKLISCPEYKV